MQKFLYGIGAACALIIIAGFALPSESRVEVSTRIDAHPGTVFALVNDFRRVELWSPRKAGDPNARIVYSGPVRGTGASVEWRGTIAGSGTQTIVESRPYEYVATVINPGEAGESRTWFSIREQGTGSEVTWGFAHDYGLNIIGRYFALLMNGVLRREYETGLTELAALAESLPKADFRSLDIEFVDTEALDIAYIPTTSPPRASEVSAALGKAFFEILAFMDSNRLVEAGPPMSVMHNYSGAQMRFDAAIPVRGLTGTTPRDDDVVRIGTTYAGPALRATHVGSYRSLAETHRKIVACMAAMGFERGDDPWESYVTDPGSTPESELRTLVYYPVRRR